MRGLLNAGHQRNRYVTRVVGNDHTPHRFATFAMAALAGIGDLPDTIMDRSVVIRMRRRAEGESVKPFRSRRDSPALHDLRDRHRRMDRAAARRGRRPGTGHAGRGPRRRHLGTPGDRRRPRRRALARLARAACAQMVTAEAAAEEDHPSAARILADIRRVFVAQREVDSLSTDELLHHLRQDPEGPWAEWGRDGLSPREPRLDCCASSASGPATSASPTAPSARATRATSSSTRGGATARPSTRTRHRPSRRDARADLPLVPPSARRRHPRRRAATDRPTAPPAADRRLHPSCAVPAVPAV